MGWSFGHGFGPLGAEVVHLGCGLWSHEASRPVGAVLRLASDRRVAVPEFLGRRHICEGLACVHGTLVVELGVTHRNHEGRGIAVLLKEGVGVALVGAGAEAEATLSLGLPGQFEGHLKPAVAGVGVEDEVWLELCGHGRSRFCPVGCCG